MVLSRSLEGETETCGLEREGIGDIGGNGWEMAET